MRPAAAIVRTGDLWFSPALSPNVKPRKLGRFTEIGKPIADPDK